MQHPRHPLARNVLIDFEGQELDVCRKAYEVFGSSLHAVRLDTHGGRLHQGGHDQPVPDLVDRILAAAEDKEAAHKALDQYGFGPGVTIEAAYNVRRALDEAGAKDTNLVVSSGFTAEKVAAFRACRAPMDAIGTGSWVEFLVFTSDITHVLEDASWSNRSKIGRGDEIAIPPLDLRIQRC